MCFLIVTYFWKWTCVISYFQGLEISEFMLVLYWIFHRIFTDLCYLTNQPKYPITNGNNTKPTGKQWMNKKPNTKTLLREKNLWKPMRLKKNASLNSETLSLKIWTTCSWLKVLSLTEAFLKKRSIILYKNCLTNTNFLFISKRNYWNITICTKQLTKIVILIVNVIENKKTAFCFKNLCRKSIN